MKITLLEKGRTLGKKAMYTGIILFALGIIIYLLQNSEISNVLIAITVLSYFFVWWGGSTWLFCHSLKGYMERKMLVIGDEIEPETEYTGTAAKIYGVIGVILAVFFFLLSFLPVGIFVLDSINGQVIDNSSVSINDDMRYYDSDILSFEYPNTYSMYEEKEMLVVLGEKGKVIIGGFEPSVGHPDPEEVHFLFQGIWYNKDPKMEVDRGVPSAVYYAHGDEETQKEIRQIVGSIEVKNL